MSGCGPGIPGRSERPLHSERQGPVAIELVVGAGQHGVEDCVEFLGGQCVGGGGAAEVEREEDAEDFAGLIDDGSAGVAGFGDGREDEHVASSRRGVFDVRATGDDLLGDAHRRLPQRTAAGMAEERPDIVDVALATLERWHAEPGHFEHREVAVGIECDDVGIELCLRRASRRACSSPRRRHARS